MTAEWRDLEPVAVPTEQMPFRLMPRSRTDHELDGDSFRAWCNRCHAVENFNSPAAAVDWENAHQCAEDPDDD